MRQVVRCVLSGSYRNDQRGLKNAYNELVTCGCQVLSPHRLDFDSDEALFVRDVAEKQTSELELERHHLLSIKQADFLWIHAPEGYVGTSTAFELGYAIANNVPIFAEALPTDVMLRNFVYKVPSVYKVFAHLDARRFDSLRGDDT